MDYEYYQGKLQDIKNALDEGYKLCADNFKRQESLYKDNIYFIDTLMQEITYKKITEDNLAVIQKILREETTVNLAPTQFQKEKESESRTINSFSITRCSNSNINPDNSSEKNIQEDNSEEVEVIRTFMEEYKAGKLSSNYEVLGVSRSYAQKLAFMNQAKWNDYQDKERISLSSKDVNRSLYFAYAVKEKPNIYFVIPARPEMSAFGGTKALQSAYPIFFDFDMEVCASEYKRAAKLVAPAVVVEKDGEYKLYVDKNGKAWKGKIEF